jgi:hypothetical protein
VNERVNRRKLVSVMTHSHFLIWMIFIKIEVNNSANHK